MAETGDRMQWLFENAPKSVKDSPYGGFQLALLGMGLPAGVVGGNLYSQFFNQAVSRGQNPMEVLPWMNGSWGGPAGNSAKPNTKDPLADMPEWYRKWYEAQGQYGGVRPVRGIL